MTVEVRATILSRIAGGESLRGICLDEAMPSRETVRECLAADPEFAGQYARAREEQADTLAEECLAIVDNPDLKADDKRVRFDARRWFAGKVAPKKYGERQVVAGDPDAPQVHRHEGVVGLQPADAYKRMLGG